MCWRSWWSGGGGGGDDGGGGGCGGGGGGGGSTSGGGREWSYLHRSRQQEYDGVDDVRREGTVGLHLLGRRVDERHGERLAVVGGGEAIQGVARKTKAVTGANQCHRRATHTTRPSSSCSSTKTAARPAAARTSTAPARSPAQPASQPASQLLCATTITTLDASLLTRALRGCTTT